MKVQKIDNVNFAALNLSKVKKCDMSYIDKYSKELEELGKLYDISIKSKWETGWDMAYPTLKITVSKLNSGFSLFSKKSKNTFYQEGSYALGMKEHNILDAVKNAIKWL